MENIKELMDFLSTLDSETFIAIAIESQSNLKLQAVATTMADFKDNESGEAFQILVFIADNTNFELN
jgi:hypothetical protein